MSLAVLADHMASKGRNGDTMLVHMAPEEVAGLHALALSHGGYMTINPQTGLPEAFSLKGLLKSALPMIAGFALGPAGFGIVSSALGAGALVGGATALATGSLQKGLMAGLGAYGGASLGGALSSTGSLAMNQAAVDATLAANPGLTAGEIAREMGTQGFVAPQIAASANPATAGVFDKLGAGIKALGTGAGRADFMKEIGGGSGLIKAGYAAAAPILADQAVQTATQMPGGQRYQGTIRPYRFDPFTRTWTAQPTYAATPVRTDAEPNPQEQQPPGGYRGGGIVALADGGMPNIKQFMDKTGADFNTASDLLYGVIGSNQDTRNWNAIMAAQDPVAAARQATANMYGGISEGTVNVQTPYGTQTHPMLRSGTGVDLTSDVSRRENFGYGLTPNAASPLAAFDPTQQATPTAAQLAAQQSIVNDPQAAALAAARSGIAAGMTNQQIADMVNMQYGKSFSAQNVADFMAANNITRPAPVVQTPVVQPPVSTSTEVVFGGDTVIPPYVAPQPQVTLGEAFQPTAPTMSNVVSTYEQGGGSTRMPTITDIKPGERTYTLNEVANLLTGYLQANPNAVYSDVQKFAASKGIPEMQARAAYNEFRFSTMTGGTKNAYDYLMGRAPYSTKPFVPGGGPIAVPYAEAMGLTSSAMGRFRPTMPPSGSTTDRAAQGSTSTTGTTGGTTKTTGTTGTTTQQSASERLRSTFDQSIFGKTPEEKAAYYNSLLGQGYTDEQIRAAINAPLDDNWLALRAIAERLRAGTTGGATTSSAVTGGGTTTTGGGVTTLLGGSNTTASNTGTGVDTTRSTDASTVGGVVVGNNVIDPISGGVLGVVTANVDPGTGGIIQGDVVVDPITGKIIGYSQDAGLIARLVNKNIGEEPAPIESRYVPSDTAYYDFGQGDIGGYGGSYTQEEMDMMAGMRKGGLADVAAMSAARGGQFNLGSYSDGGRLLRGPGDGVSDSIPATIGNKQPARLADGEFVIPARIVSEIGNGSTEAGARKLYAMMDRVQRARAKTTGKGKVAKNTRAEKYLPA